MMSEIYPFGGVLAYLKYHFIDGVNKQSLMLLDKTRVDYSKPSDGADKKSTFKVKSHTDGELKGILSGFGIGVKLTDEEKANQINKELEGNSNER
jgi:hypothetical protein